MCPLPPEGQNKTCWKKPSPRKGVQLSYSHLSTPLTGGLYAIFNGSRLNGHVPKCRKHGGRLHAVLLRLALWNAQVKSSWDETSWANPGLHPGTRSIMRRGTKKPNPRSCKDCPSCPYIHPAANTSGVPVAPIHYRRDIRSTTHFFPRKSWQ